MVDTQNTTPDPQDGPQEPGQSTEAQQDTPEDQEPQEPHEQRDEIAESRKYRKRAQEAEARLEAATAKLAELQSKEIIEAASESIDVSEFHWRDIFPHLSEERAKEIVAEHQRRGGLKDRHTARLIHPEDLFVLGGVEKASVLTEYGIDRDKIVAATIDLYRTRPELFTTKGPVPSNPGQPIDKTPAPSASWDQVIKGRRS